MNMVDRRVLLGADASQVQWAAAVTCSSVYPNTMGVAFAVKWTAEPTLLNDGFGLRQFSIMVLVFLSDCGRRDNGAENENNLVKFHCCSSEE